jgi:hypothetical protein
LSYFRLCGPFALFLCAAAIAPASAQTAPTADAVTQNPAVPAAKVKKPVAKRAVSAQPAGGKSMSLGDDKAARLEEGRKKFFEQSSGFENSKGDMPLSLSNGKDGGFSPGMGLKF